SYLWARLHPVRTPRSLEEWVSNQFGHRLFQIFFKTYTEKVWGISTGELSADWAAQRIKGLNLSAAIKSALWPRALWPRKTAGTGTGRGGRDRDAVLTTLIDRFRYPPLGPGQMWETVRDRLVAGGNQVRLGQQVVGIHHADGRVTHVSVRPVGTDDGRAGGRGGDVDGADDGAAGGGRGGADGRGAGSGVDGAGGGSGSGATAGQPPLDTVAGTHFISTLPIRELVNQCVPPLPEPVVRAANSLKYRDFLTVAVVIQRAQLFPDNWIYIHDPTVKVGRIQNFKNWSPALVPDPATTCLGLEYFCFEGDGLWTASDADLVGLARRELVALGICAAAEEVAWGVVVRQPKAYPVYDDEYKRHLGVIKTYLETALPNLALVGRNGMHHYNNQDHSMMTALLVARNIALGTHYDPWKVNTEAAYHEEARLEDPDHSGRQVPTLAQAH
ncbi:MAG: hypothetical protein IVW57_17545, partial [Ktedonobacterales bacterium]|nr:hypothetical protein [Ktedonobacterales bacterium]